MHSNFTTIDDFKAELIRRENSKKDYITPTEKMTMSKDAKSIEIDGIGNFDMLSNFEGQIIANNKMPTKHFRRLQEDHPDLLSEYFNREWKSTEQKRMIRTLDENARAFMSDMYRPFDNAFALKASAPVFDQFKDKGMEVKSYSLTDDNMFFQVVLPSFSAEVVPGDVVHQGLTLRNSEVGKAALEVKSLIWRLVCSNGMVGETVLSRRHVGSRIDFDDDATIYQHDTIQAELESYQLRMRDAINATLTEEMFAERIDNLREANEDTVSKKKVRKVIEVMTKDFSFNEEELDGIFANVAEESNYSRYGIANGITALVHEENNPDKAYELERAGNKIITLSSGDWEKIVKAA